MLRMDAAAAADRDLRRACRRLSKRGRSWGGTADSRTSPEDSVGPGRVAQLPRLAGPATITPFARGPLRRIPFQSFDTQIMSDQMQTTPQPQDENHLIAERREKLAAWRASGGAFPNDFSRENTAGKLDELYGDKDAEALEATPVEVRVAGRIMLKRIMGKASFVTIQDLSGRIQLYVQRDGVGEDVYAQFKTWDIGDIVGCVGTVFKTKTGELTVKAAEIRLLTKSLRPLPDKFHGLTDVEQKYRQRYVDLIMNEQSRFTWILASVASSSASVNPAPVSSVARMSGRASVR